MPDEILKTEVNHKLDTEPSQTSSRKTQSEQDAKLPEGPPELADKLPLSIHEDKLAEIKVKEDETLIEVKLPNSVHTKINHKREHSEVKLTKRESV